MRSEKKLCLVICLLMLVATTLFAQTAHVVSSTNANHWVVGTPVEGTAWASTTNYLEVLPNTKYQTIQGFGGCFCEIGWDAVNSLSSAGRDSVIRALFDTSGFNYTFCRMPIGANDFAVGYYSLNDVSGDYQMTNFSLKRDSTKLIPFIKAAQAYKPNLRFWASPWTPPSWMKSNNNYAGGNMNSASDQVLTAYALYLSKTVQEFKKCGINIEYITCQNEPDQCSQNYPTCCWTNAQELKFYKNFMIPRFQQDNLTTQILIGVYCCGNYSDWVTYFMNDATVKAKVGFISHSWQTEAWGQQAWNDYPNVPFMQTEADWGQNGTHDWNEGVNQFNSMTKFLTNGKAVVFTQWNMILDQKYSSNWGFKQSAPININTSTKVVTYEPHYWAVKHIIHDVAVGAKVISVTTAGTNPGSKLAFLNPNGDIVVAVSNTGSSAYAATIKNGNIMYKTSFPGNSFNTVKITSASSMVQGKNETMHSIKPILNEAFIFNTTLYIQLSTMFKVKELDLSLFDMQGRMVWKGHRRGNAIQGGQQSFAVHPGYSLTTGSYLLLAKIKDELDAVTKVEKKVSAVAGK